MRTRPGLFETALCRRAGRCARRFARTVATIAAAATFGLAGVPAQADDFDYEYEFPYWVEPDRVVDWRSSLSIGATYSSAQSESYNLSLQGELERVTGSDRWLSNLWAISGRSDGNETAALFDVRTRYDRDIRKRWFTFVQGEYRRDRPGNLERRTSIGTGFGYRIAERRYLAWSVIAGLGYTAESFYTPLDIIGGLRTSYNRAEGVLGTEAEFELMDNLTLTHRLTWYPNLTYGSAYRLVYDATARAAITKRLSLDITASWRQSTEPGADKRPDELLVITGLALRLD